METRSKLRAGPPASEDSPRGPTESKEVIKNDGEPRFSVTV